MSITASDAAMGGNDILDIQSGLPNLGDLVTGYSDGYPVTGRVTRFEQNMAGQTLVIVMPGDAYARPWYVGSCFYVHEVTPA